MRLSLALLLNLGLMLPLPLAAQQDVAGDSATARSSQDPQLVFEREIFTYPVFQRRNPFRPLLADAGGGPRFEAMRLDGIIYSSNRRFRIALMSAGRVATPGTAEAEGAGLTARLRAGDRWGNVRILEIQPTQVVVEVTEFGLTEQRTMDLPPRGQGGSR